MINFYRTEYKPIKEDDVLFINANEHYEKAGRLKEGEDGDGEANDIQKIVDTYKYR
jgi:hypothetical protein